MIKLIKNRLLTRTPLRFDVATLTGIGGRDNLEDAVGQLSVDPHTACWVVADGVGGQGAGEVAAQLVVETILQGFGSNPVCSRPELCSLLESARRAVSTARQPDSPTANMASTVVALLAANNQAVWGYVGDSRLYHFRAGKLLHRTEDQSLVNLLRARGALTKADIATFPQRNMILHALGQDEAPEIRLHGPVQLQAEDGFLLCSDGVWELVGDDELLQLWQASRSAGYWLSILEQLLLSRVTEKNSAGHAADNFTAVVIKVSGNHKS